MPAESTPETKHKDEVSRKATPFMSGTRLEHFSSHELFNTLIEFITMNDTGVNIHLFWPLENQFQELQKHIEKV